MDQWHCQDLHTEIFTKPQLNIKRNKCTKNINMLKFCYNVKQFIHIVVRLIDTQNTNSHMSREEVAKLKEVTKHVILH
jgi:hypothetical protein